MVCKLIVVVLYFEISLFDNQICSLKISVLQTSICSLDNTL